MRAAAGLPARPLHERIRTATRVAAVPVAWFAWRWARSGYWSEQLAARRGAHARYWEELAQRPGDVLYVAIGDATAQGIGAREPAGSYVGQLERMLAARLQVINLSISGARLADVITALLPRLRRIDTTDALVTFSAGANDLGDFDPHRFAGQLATILDALPDHALVADIPRLHLHPAEHRVDEANAILHELADARDLAVIPLHGATSALGAVSLATHYAADLIHPNDRGYRVWAKTFAGPAAVRLEQITSSHRARSDQR